LNLANRERRKQYLLENDHTSPSKYIPQLFIRLRGWSPYLKYQLEEAIQLNSLKRHTFTNLTLPQRILTCN
jgi:hypothetical protein